jgi:fibronectin-binding autotransporter adhesin
MSTYDLRKAIYKTIEDEASSLNTTVLRVVTFSTSDIQFASDIYFEITMGPTTYNFILEVESSGKYAVRGINFPNDPSNPDSLRDPKFEFKVLSGSLFLRTTNILNGGSAFPISKVIARKEIKYGVITNPTIATVTLAAAGGASGWTSINTFTEENYFKNIKTSDNVIVGGSLTVSGTSAITGDVTLTGDLFVNGGDITTSSGTLNIGNTATSAQTVNLGTAATANGVTKTVNLGTNGATGSTTNINIGSVNGGITTINSGTLVGAATTQNLYNTTATTINFGGVSTALTIGAASAGFVSIRNTGSATSTATTGALRVAGGINQTSSDTNYLTGATTIVGAATLSSTLGVTGVTTILNNTSTSSASTGALVVTGGVGIGGSTTIGGNISLVGASSLSTTTGDLTLSTNGGNGNIILSPNGTGDVYIDGDTLRVGDSGSASIITSNGAGNLTIKTGSTNSGAVLINQGDNGNIEITPHGNGKLISSKNLEILGNTLSSTATAFNFLTTLETISIGSASGNTTINNALIVGSDTTVQGDLSIQGEDLRTTATTFNILPKNITTVDETYTVNIATGANSAAGSKREIYLGSNLSDKVVIPGNLTISGDITVTKTAEYSNVLIKSNEASFLIEKEDGTDLFSVAAGSENKSFFKVPLNVDNSFSVSTDKFTVSSAGAVGIDSTLSVGSTSTLTGLLNANGGIAIAADKFTMSSGGVGVINGELTVDNLKIDGTTISSTDTDGSITLAPNGNGDVFVDADTLRVGDLNAASTITTNGTGNLTIKTGSTNSGSILINQGDNGNIEISPHGTGDVYLNTDTLKIGDSGEDAIIQSNGNADLTIKTGNATTGTITLIDGSNGNITISTDGTGAVVLSNTTDSTSATSGGSLRVAGGAGIAKKLYVGDNLEVTADLAVNGGDITSTSENFNLINGNIANKGSSTNIAVNLSSGTIGNNVAKTINIGTGNISATSASQTINIGSSSSVDKTTLNLYGNLNVSGTVTAVSSNEVNLGDSTLTLNSDITTSAGNADGGIQVKRLHTDNVERRDAELLWDENNKYWEAGYAGTLSEIATQSKKLNFFTTTSADELRNFISGTTGTGNLVFATSPSFTTPTLGSATATSINKLTISTPTNGSTLTIADGKTLTANQSITLTGDAARTLTINGADKTLAGAATTLTFGGNFTHTGAHTLGVTTTENTSVTLPTTGTLATLAGSEALTNKSINGLTITSSTGTLTIANEKTLSISDNTTIANGSLTLANGKLLTLSDSTTLGTNSVTLASGKLITAQYASLTIGADGKTGNIIIRSSDSSEKTLELGGSPTISGSSTLALNKNLTVNDNDFTLTASGAARTLSIAGGNVTLTGQSAGSSVELPASGTLATTAQLHTRSHAMTSTDDHTAGNWKLFYSNASGQITELALGADNTVLKGEGASTAPTFGQVAYSEISGTPTIGDGTLSWGAASAGATNTTVAGSLSGAYSANTSTNRTLNLAIGPALTNLATTMTGVGSGFLRKNGADTYSIDTSTYLTSESDTLALVTGRGNTTGTAISLTNTATSTSTTTGALIVSGGVGIGGNVHIGGDLYFSSDERLKTKIEKLEPISISEKISSLNIWKYVYTADKQEKKHIGLMAQDLEKTFPEISELLVESANDEISGLEDKRSIKETKLSYVLWLALQEEIKHRKAIEERLSLLEKSLGGK